MNKPAIWQGLLCMLVLLAIQALIWWLEWWVG